MQMTALKSFAGFLILIACVCCGGRAAQAQTCTASYSNLAFGSNINILAGASIDSAGSMTINCSGFGPGRLQQAAVCVSLGNGLNSTGAPRLMSSGAGALAYDLYMDSARTSRWGDTPTTEPGFVLTSANPSATVPVYGRIIASQTTAPVGSYFDYIMPTLLFGFFNGVGRQPTCAQLTNFTTSPPFAVTAAITANCSVSATNMTFPPQTTFANPVNSQSSVTITCTSQAPYWIALDGGTSGASDPTQRKMSLAGHSITYGLYRDSANRSPWGNTQSVNTAVGTGSAGPNTFIVYGLIPRPPAIPLPGVYQDTVTVTVNF